MLRFFYEVGNMKHYLIMCRSVTGAQRAERILERALIHASAVKAPAHLTRSGCAYAIRLHAKLEEALLLLDKNGIRYGKIFVSDNGTEYGEVSL